MSLNTRGVSERGWDIRALQDLSDREERKFHVERSEIY